MKRTQLYLDEDIWQALHMRSRQSNTSVSELVRRAVRERYAGGTANRQRAMEALVGLWKDRPNLADSETYVRRLRRGKRLKRILP